MTDGTAQASGERRRAPKRRALQRTILDAARRVLERREPTDVTLELVAAEAELPLESVETCFRTAHDLLLSLGAQELAGLARAMYSDRKDERQWMAASSGALSLLRAAKQILGSTETESPLPAAPEDAGADEVLHRSPPSWTNLSGNEEGDAEQESAAPLRKLRASASLLRKAAASEGAPSIGPELGQILSDLTSEEVAVPDTATTLARLERRLYLLERTLADRQEETSREKANAAVLVDESVNSLNQRVKALEKLQNEVASEVRSAMADFGGRLRLVEAMPPAPNAKPARGPAAEGAPTRPMVPERTTQDDMSPSLESLVPESSSTDSTLDLKLDSVLATARRAAIEAAVERAKADDSGRSRLLMPLTRALRNKKSGRRALMLLGVAGLACTALAFVLGYRNGASEVVPAPQSVAQAGVVVAPTGTQPDFAPLERLLELAAANNPKAELLLGLRYMEGEGVPRNEAEAFHWFQESAEGGEALAQYWLANLYTRENSAMADPEQAVRWYDAAAKQGNRMAMNNLAVAHADGMGTPKNMGQAARWFGEAAQLGYVVSQFNLAVLHERGEGVPQDLAEAYKWYAVAAGQGDGEARKRLETLAAELPPADLARAQAAAQNFKPAPMERTANFAPQMSDLAGG